MPQLPHPKECLWTATAGSTSFPALDGDREAEVVVLGGGVIGLTAALLLRAEGRGVTLLERDGVGLGVSARSTVKLSAGHGLLYSKIHRRFGAEVTAEYGRANLRGLRMMRDLVGQHGIDCDWEAADHYVWASDDRELDQVRAEVDAERVGGLDAELLDAAPELPFPVAGALRLRDQVRCHPRGTCSASRMRHARPASRSTRTRGRSGWSRGSQPSWRRSTAGFALPPWSSPRISRSSTEASSTRR